MRPLDLKEFAQRLRIEGNEFAEEILDLIELENEVAQPYSELCDDLEHYAPALTGMPAKAVEWLGDRAELLAGIEGELEKAERPGDADDVVKELLGTLEQAEVILRASGWTEGDFLDALQALADRAPVMAYDL